MFRQIMTVVKEKIAGLPIDSTNRYQLLIVISYIVSTITFHFTYSA